MDVPATEPDEQELHPHRRQPQPHMVFEELLPLLVPPTEPVEPLLQVQVHVQRFEVLELLGIVFPSFVANSGSRGCSRNWRRSWGIRYRHRHCYYT